MSDKDRILSKIRKCLALAKSSNENEAAAALRQAQKLMEMHDIDSAELAASGASEASTHAGAAAKPARWESILANVIADAFACHLIFVGGWGSGKWHFIGAGPRPEIAQYAFAVLFRQLRRSRAEFIKSHCRRLKTINKTRRADVFCLAWAFAVADKAMAMAIPEDEQIAIDAFVVRKYPALESIKPRDSTRDRKLDVKDWNAFVHGNASGSAAQLDRGVGAATAPELIGAPA